MSADTNGLAADAFDTFVALLEAFQRRMRARFETVGGDAMLLDPWTRDLGGGSTGASPPGGSTGSCPTSGENPSPGSRGRKTCAIGTLATSIHAPRYTATGSQRSTD